MLKKRKRTLGIICIINCCILLFGGWGSKLLTIQFKDAAAVANLEYPLSINTISIQLAGGDLSYIQDSQENYLSGNMQIYDASGIIRYQGEIERFKGRGNNSWYCPKKGYGIRLQTPSDLINLGKARGFVLTPTYRDASLLNFKIAYDLSNEVGILYAHSADYVELYVNQEYLGVYLLTEQNEINKDRYALVNLEELTQAMNDEYLFQYTPVSEYDLEGETQVERKAYWEIANNPHNITGGYLLELDQADKVGKSPSRFRSQNGTPIGLRSPAYASKEQVEYISEYYQEFEDALYAEDGYNTKGKYYLEYIDLDSFAKTWIMNELTMDTSIYSSQFFWKDSDAAGDGKFHAGCVWDMEHSFVEQNRTVDYLRGGGFWGSFYKHPEFRKRVYYIWMEKYIPAIEKLYGTKQEYKSYQLNSIDTYVEYIRKAAEHNFEKWNESWEENVDDRGVSSWEEEIAYVKQFIAERSAYMTVSLAAYEENFQSMYQEGGVYYGIKEEKLEAASEGKVVVEYIPDDRIALLSERMKMLYAER